MLTVQTLKFFAMATMLIDHLAAFFPQIFPIWFRWIGRLSAPIFMFCVTEGIRHTSSRKAYLTRMYIFSVVMGVMDVVLNLIYPQSPHPMTNNIMSTFFLVGIFVVLIQMIRKKQRVKGISPIIIMIAFVVVQFVLSVIWINFAMSGKMNLSVLFAAILPNLLGVEGTTFFVMVGIVMYFSASTDSNKKNLIFSLSYGALCLIMFMSAVQTSLDIRTIFIYNFQWMMIGSLPIILAYNGKRGPGGRGMKYLFYCFYPAHLAVLFLLSNWI